MSDAGRGTAPPSSGSVTPYDVVVGHGVSDRVVGLLGAGVRQVLVVHPEAFDTLRRARGRALARRGSRSTVAAVPDNEVGQGRAEVAAGCGRCWASRPSPARMPWWRSGAAPSPTSRGSSRPPGCAGWRSCTCRRRCSRWSTPPSGARPASTPPRARTSSGAFHEPAGVLCDLDVLATLPRADLVAGLAEVVKAGFIADPVILELVEADPGGATRWDGPHTRELVERAIAVKAEVVGAGPHRVVAARDPQLRAHLRARGRAGRGLPPPARGGRGDRHDLRRRARAALGHLGADVVARHRSVLSSVGLPTAYPGGRWDDLLAAMRRDKKSRGALLRFVVLEDVGRARSGSRGPTRPGCAAPSTPSPR